MHRITFAIITTLGLAVTALAQQPTTPLPSPAPMTPPAKPAAPLATPTPMPSVMSATPTVTPQMVAESCATAHEDCGTSCCGIRTRLASLWSGRRCRESYSCTSCFPGYKPDGYVPIYNGVSNLACSASCRDHRFGTGRFATNECCESECDPWRPLRNHIHLCILHRDRCPRERCHGEHAHRGLLIERAHCREGRCCRVPTPFITPARQYFFDHCEPHWPTVVNYSGSAAATCGLGLGSGAVSRVQARRVERGNLGTVAQNCETCGDARGRLIKHKWERHDWANGCCVLGQPLTPCLRFARDEKMSVPEVVVGEPELGGYGLFNYLYFAKKDAPATQNAVPANVLNGTTVNPVMQAGYKPSR